MTSVSQTFYEHNLSSYYVLPLIGVNKSMFDGFVNTYISADGEYALVHLAKPLTSIFYSLKTNLVATIDCHVTNKHFMVYQIPKRWQDDVCHYLGGRITRMSEEAKQIIRTRSGLAVRVMRAGVYYTDYRICAIDPVDSPVRQRLRSLLIEEMGCSSDMFMYDAEIVPLPNTNEFVYIPNLPRSPSS